MYIINEPLTIELAQQIIINFENIQKPKLVNYKNYYDGKQEIINRTFTDATKPNNRIVTNYCKNIVDNYQGYLTGIPITYAGKEGFEEIQKVLNYNDVKDTDNKLLKNALIYGVAYELEYLDEEAQNRFAVLDSMECIPIYGNNLQNTLEYVIRYYQQNTMINAQQPKWIIEIYDQFEKKTYKADNQFSAFELYEREPHYYKQVPITVFALNDDYVSIFDKVMTLQDAYNVLLSDEINDFVSFCDAYLTLKGVDMDATELAKMKELRALILPEGASVDYLTKQVNDAQLQNMLKTINDNIHKIANSPDFNDEKLLAQSGIAMRYKLLGFEFTASNIESAMKKALQRRIELISTIMELTGSNILWRDVTITMSRNLPINTLEAAQEINQLRGLVSTKTLLSLLPFISDPQQELKALEDENQITSNLYGN